MAGPTRHNNQLHRSEDAAGDPIPNGWIPASDGATNWIWIDPATLAVASLTPMTVYDPTIGNWLPLVDGDGNQIMSS